MASIIEAVKHALVSRNYTIHGVSYSFDHTDIGDAFERQESTMSFITLGGDVAPVPNELRAFGTDPISGKNVVAVLVGASGMIGSFAVQFQLNFAIKLGEPYRG